MAPLRQRPVRSALALLSLGAAWRCAFTGPLRPATVARTQMKGYRLDWMLEQKDGTNTLQTQDGYWVGEKGFHKSQAAQGLRYRMRPTPEEFKAGKEVDGYIYQFGPVKLRLGEAFGGTGVNEAQRELKRKIVREGLSDTAKLEENEYWIKRYGYKRWTPYNVDQASGDVPGRPRGFLRGLAAWSGRDPLKEERGVSWFEADYGKPWLAKYVNTKLPGWVTAEQVQKEYNTGKLSLPEKAESTK